MLLGGTLWLRHQQQTMEHLRMHNQQLVMQGEALQSRLLQWQSQATSLSVALTEQKKQRHTLEEMSEQTRQRLQNAVERSSCASQPVPVDIIRLQRDALNRRAMSN
jgi:septal ring factor EnvC (AmiA/AmiB activator)